MKNTWSSLIKNEDNTQDPGPFKQWMGEESPLPESPEGKSNAWRKTEFQVDNKPIEPEGDVQWRPSLFKGLIFLIIIVYALVSYFHVPILTSIGEYLVVRNPLKKSDLIVCMAGGAVERGLETADVYLEGFAPRVFVSRERLSPGYSVLEERGVNYPESKDLLIEFLAGLGIRRSAVITSDSFVESTIEEALVVRSVVLEKGYGSLIVVTSPTHTRRSLLTFRHVFEEDDIEIIVTPSRYSDFKADAWWKTRWHLKEVLLEYQKLIYYTVKYFW